MDFAIKNIFTFYSEPFTTQASFVAVFWIILFWGWFMKRPSLRWFMDVSEGCPLQVLPYHEMLKKYQQGGQVTDFEIP